MIIFLRISLVRMACELRALRRQSADAPELVGRQIFLLPKNCWSSFSKNQLLLNKNLKCNSLLALLVAGLMGSLTVARAADPDYWSWARLAGSVFSVSICVRLWLKFPA